MSWQRGWGVTYFNRRGKLKEKTFGFSEAKAREFYQMLDARGHDAALFNYRPQTIIDQILETKVLWLWGSIPAWHLALLLGAVIALLTAWRLFP